ncbi:VOC family protein [Oceanibacterium hippocampi]|uniref:VOC domain-containing protein n=1 Tax=Oceanibacterium hippocampi TaxID=745714 RepID=A0A1Y5RAA0_9PROT|nr:VOC family protein [Oceanibacterium hippocampi]SLN12652.1 hypothetical protein OCH7691_00182 [Oceanibacterium hippocampi]
MRQVVFVAGALQPAVDELRDVLGLDICFRDPGVAEFGLENALLPVNGNFLEVVSPTKEGTTAGRYLERRGGAGGYMLLFQCDDAAAVRERLLAKGLRAVWCHDEPDCVATHYHPQDLPGAIVSIDSMSHAGDWHKELADWKWAGPAWRQHVATERVQALAAVEIRAEDPGALGARWSDVFERPLGRSANGAPAIAFDNITVRFVEAQDESCHGITGVDILPQDRNAILAAAEARGLRTGDNQMRLAGVTVTLI